ncbi:MAG TPA: DUF4429 domain-containing protein [Streptosporangiaceae bacterium]|nr:DUF4429 domain-containing protein [Streptosporangiaceae bacterium]
MNEVVSASGKTGQVSFDGRFVTITRGGMARLRAGTTRDLIAGGGEKRIPVSSITAVQWKPASHLASGLIQFTIAGGIERRGTFGRAVREAKTDENSVVFAPRQQADFERVRNAVEEAIAAR